MKEITNTKNSYNKLAHRWAARATNSFFHEEPFRYLVKKLKKGNRVIDIGCANGIHVPMFLGIGRDLKYEGFDISRTMLKMAKARYPQLPFNLLDISDPKTLPKKKYNAFWAAAVLMHVPKEKWEDMFSNIEKLVEKKGYGYVIMPEKRPKIFSEEDQRHFTLVKPAEFKKYLQNRGWKILKQGMLSSHHDMPWNWYIVQLP